MLPHRTLFITLSAFAILLCTPKISCQEDDVEIETEDVALDEKAAKTDENFNLKPEVELKENTDIDITMLFTDAEIKVSEKELPANFPIRVLVGVRNEGKNDYIFDSMQGSLHYAQDWSYHIQNFSLARYNRLVTQNQEATFEYLFNVHESLVGRPFGLTLVLNYLNNEGDYFRNTVYNETITVYELDAGIDLETVFLYVLGLGLVAIGAIFGYQYTTGKSITKAGTGTGGNRKQREERKQAKRVVETGTRGDDIDREWLDHDTVRFVSKSPKTSPQKSPRARVVLRK